MLKAIKRLEQSIEHVRHGAREQRELNDRDKEVIAVGLVAQLLQQQALLGDNNATILQQS